eukprot:CAMPEP_0183727580 /NCGR_PEP_ID=MMETSP0737-20130205/25898_1 /TAXON_ID=385413 /ORGANISM="Thalassiosira miniscula, Strain CCMP1093" /LENGTH=185 /DNA_ID=CAMNT_0025959247 /DNA_START=202 /DNA_END=759 /DNA_ORIENTATION=-
MKAYTLVLIVAIVAVATGYADAAMNIFNLVNLKEIWLQRPYTGPEVVVEIIGVDLNRRANRFFDRWSNPDVYVTIEHFETERKTQIEGNTYQPRFLWKTKMPHYKTYGMRFVVYDANVLKDDEVVGRAFIDTDQIADMMKTMEPGLLSLGENIGVMKVAVTAPPTDLREKGTFPLTSTVKRLDAP